MKKVIILVAVLATIFSSCSRFDSKPVEPHIIGVSNLQYDAKSGLYYCVIDSMQYTVSEVTIPDESPRTYSKTQPMAAVEGMKVTIFTTPHHNGVQAVVGEQSEEQIEEMYKENHTFYIVFLGLMIIWVIIFIVPKTNKKHHSQKL
ncbi:MAG: hypothetical protein J6T72_02100 [Alphaproteobacteria bacterium]|nr:hypothetical protein [Alphaproteobacteria bacterium]